MAPLAPLAALAQSQSGGLPDTNARVAVLEATVATLQTNLAAETAARQAADTALQNNINNVQANITNSINSERAARQDSLRAYERMEWARAQLEGWMIEQASEGMLRAMEGGRGRRLRSIQAKTAIAELAESVLARICRIIGGGTLSRSSPFGFWYEDVRALGFLRPPWGLSYDQLFAA